MFAENLLESAGPRHGRRGWTTAASLTAQAAVLSLIALVPIVYPDAISMLRPAPISIPMFSPVPAPPTPLVHPQAGPAPTTPSATLIPARDSTIHFGRPSDASTPPVAPPSGLSIPGVALTLIPTGRPPDIGLERTEIPKTKVRLSQMEAGSLVHNVRPIYPHIAIASRIEGTVVLHALISREGNVESLQVISGHPLLAGAALDAVRQWRYRPYVLNGQPVEVETQVTVNFTLGNN